MKTIGCSTLVLASLVASATGFTSPSHTVRSAPSTELFGLFDGWNAGGSGNSKESLDEQWEAQQRMLKMRQGSTEERKKYFEEIEERRLNESKKQDEMWSWQSKNYKKGEDPLDEWKKRRKNGSISDLEDQYKDVPKGGIPLPGASFGVGGEFGVGGKFDNGGRFDLRLPYANQGYEDQNADVMAKIGNFFGGGKKKEVPPPEPEPEPVQKNKWPWEK